MPRPGISRWNGFLRHRSPNAADRVGGAHPYGGYPIGLDALTRCYFSHTFNRVADFDANDWTAVGSAAISDNVAPSFLRLTTTGVDDNVCSAQFMGAGGGGEFFRLRPGTSHLFEVAFRTGDVNGNAASVRESEIFLGWMRASAAIFTGPADYIGFYKNDFTADSTNLFYFVGGRNNVAALDVVTTSNAVKFTTGLALGASNAIDSNATNQSEGYMETTSLGEFTRLGFIINVNASALCDVFTYVNRVHTATSGGVFTDNGIATNVLPADEELCITLAIRAGEGVAKVLDIEQVTYMVMED